MKRPLPHSAFTLIEMLTVMLVIAILASLILAVNGLAQTKAGRARAEGEIKTLEAGIENYKADNGSYPRNSDTDKLDPRTDGNPATGGGATKYQKSSLYLYSALSGDYAPEGNPDNKPEEKSYLPDFFKPNVLSTKKDANGQIIEVKYIQDPFGNSYGYSTRGAKAEEDFQAELRKDPKATRPSEVEGFNPTFDLWSTAGSVSGVTPKDQAKWQKNW